MSLVTLPDRREVFLLARDFAAWLQSKPDDTQVGITNDDCHCPLACYLKETYEVPDDGSYHFSVGTSCLTVIRHLSIYDQSLLPEWAEDFVESTDHLAPNGFDQQPVTAAEAWSVLAHVVDL